MSEPAETREASEEDGASDERDQLIEQWTKPTWTRRAAPVVLVVGLAVALGFLRHEVPREQEITVRLEGARAQVTGVELQVVDEAGEVAFETRWGFPDGKVPGTVHGQTRVKPGPWRLRVRVEGAQPVHLERRVKLEGEPVSVPVKLEP